MVVEMAGLAAGASIVGIEPHCSPAQAEHIVVESGARGLAVHRRADAERLSPQARERMRFLLCFDGAPSDFDGAPSNAGEAKTGEWTHPAADDPAAIFFTSGTTGAPRGIEYSHRQVLLSCRSILEAFTRLDERDSTLCWLPMANLTQRTLNLAAIATGGTLYLVEDPRRVMEHIGEAKPSVFMGVPRFYEKLHSGIRERLLAGPAWRRRLVEAAMAAKAELSRRRREGRRVPLPLRAKEAVLDRLVLRKVRAALGGRMKLMVSGSAPAAPWLLAFFHDLGLVVLEAYGLTENAIPIAANRPGAHRFGTVGKLLAGNELRFDEEGEILVKGPALFNGYVGEGRPHDRFTSDGFFRTGDLGRLDADGFLTLTGRKSELIKTSTGRRVSPAGIEAAYRRSPCFDQVVVVGDGRPHLAALITLNLAAVESALERSGLRRQPGAEPAGDPGVDTLVKQELDRLGGDLSAHERIRCFAILPRPLTIAGGELTTSLKLRRDRITALHHETIERMYGEEESRALSEASAHGGAARS